MSVGFRAVQWNRDKLVYDGLLLAAVALYVTIFLIVVPRLEPPKDVLGEIDLRIRAFGSVTFLMLTAILAIGPLIAEALGVGIGLFYGLDDAAAGIDTAAVAGSIGLLGRAVRDRGPRMFPRHDARTALHLR